MPTKNSVLEKLNPLLEDPEIMELMIDGPEKVTFEKNGKIEDADIRFDSNDEVKALIEETLKMAGQSLEEGKTTYDVRLSDNSRMVAVLTPTAINGHSVIFRKWFKKQLTWERLFELGAVTTEFQALIQTALNAKVNILITGGTNSGKTTIANRVVELTSPDQRIIVVEDSHFYQFTHPRATFFEANGTSDTSYTELLTTASRMRPDWIMVGELEGAETMRALQLFSTGHAGITTMHATNPENALTRLESMCLMANLGLGMEDIKQLIASAVKLITYQERLPNGRRRVTQVTELKGLEDGRYILQPLMRYNHETEKLEATGIKPTWEE